MKAGIVTFYNHSNYGAVLQAYALQQAFEEEGIRTSHIHFPGTDPVYEIQKNPFMNKIMNESKRRDGHFADFRNQYLNVIEYTDLLSEELDFAVVGSDQVWNPMITGANPRYFLEFMPEDKRVSYAASFGGELPEQVKHIYKDALNRFHRISVRERSSVESMEELLGGMENGSDNRKPVFCMDPVFLLTKEDWERLLPEKKDVSAYMLLIMVQNDRRLLAAAQEEAARRGVLLKVITASYFPVVGFEAWSGIGVQDWLSLIRDADLIMTSSFHGLAFSLIFGKEYQNCSLTDALSGRNGRQAELLQLFGLEDCGNGADANMKIAWYREKSLQYIREVMERYDD